MLPVRINVFASWLPVPIGLSSERVTLFEIDFRKSAMFLTWSNSLIYVLEPGLCFLTQYFLTETL